MRTIGMVGAGTMGAGIAQKVASEGLPVVLVDRDEGLVRAGIDRIRATLEQGVQRKLFRPEDVAAILGRITPAADPAALRDCDLVIEAVFEDRQVKRDLLRNLEGIVRPDAILATNTSSFTVTELAEGLARPGRMVGLHYFFHPAKNRLVEVIAGARTSPEAFEAAWAFTERTGKTPIRSADASGFVVNRFFVPWINEAVRLREEGVAQIPTIEAAAKEAFGIGMGPFELMNVTGVPIAMHAARTLGEAFGPFYAPAAQLVAQGEARRPWDLAGTVDPSRAAVVRERLLAVTFLVASHLVEEGVATIEDTDIGARVGLRWPRGPFEMANRAGVAQAAGWAASLASRHRLKPPALLQRQAASAAPFRFSYVVTRRRPSHSEVWLNRPDALNALNPEVVAQMEEAWQEVTRGTSGGVVLAGKGKAFVAGADVKFFVRAMEKGDLAPVAAFTERGHRLFSAIDGSDRPVVCRLAGLSLGGGSELALCCDAIVATERGTIGFPETGIGIYPGLGGTQRLPRRVGTGLAKYLIYTGRVLDARSAEAVGLVDRVVEPSAMDAALEQALGRGTAPRPPRTLPEPWARLAAFFDRWRVDDLLAGRAQTGGDADLDRAVRAVQRKAPLALRLAERLIDGGMKGSLADGLCAELASLREIFSTRDALAGMRSVGGPPPAWEGK